MKNKNTTTKYDADADVMSWEVDDTAAHIDYATELDDLIVHFTKDNKPVLVELLNASRSARQNRHSVGVGT